MPAPWRYRGREVSAEETAFIRRFIAEQAGVSRRALSQKLCEAWQWKQANGAPRDMVCRGLLLMLHRAGEIELPPVRYTPPNPLAKREPPAAMLIDTTPIHGPLSQLQPIEWQPVRRTPEEPLFNSLMEHHHYLGYEQPVGEPQVCGLVAGAADRLSGVEFSATSLGQPRPLHRLEWGSAAAQPSLPGLQHPLSDSALGRGRAPGFAPSQPHGATGVGRLGTPLPTPHLVSGNLRGSHALSRDLLPRGQLDWVGADDRPGQG